MVKSFAFRIYIVALILRLIPVILARGMGIGLDDMFQYDMLARSLAAGHGFRWYAEADLTQLASVVDFDLTSVRDYDPALGIPTSFRAPLYPAFLSLVYFFTGTGFSRFFAARLAQAIFLGAPLAPLTYWVAKKLFPPLPAGEGLGVRVERASRISAWLAAAYPMLLVYPLGLGTENPFFVLLLASFLLLLNAIEKPTTLNFLLAGIFLGLTALTRSVILPFAGLAILYLLVMPQPEGSASAHPPGDEPPGYSNKAVLRRLNTGALFMSIVFVLTVTPWIIRNSLLHHKLTGIETSMGYNLHLGYHPEGDGSFVFGPSLDLLAILDDAERDRIGTQQAFAFIRAQPERFVPLAVNRLGFFFGLEKRVLMYFYGNNLIGYVPLQLLLAISAVLLLPFVVISTSAALGSSLLRWKPGHILLILLFAAYILPHVFILAEDRFHLALVPFIAILAAQYWSGEAGVLARRWRESRTGKIIVLLSILSVVFLVANWGFELARDWDKIAQLLGPTGNQSYFPY